MQGVPINGVIALLVTAAFFLLARELVMWYWKINQMLYELKEINQNLLRVMRAVESYKTDEGQNELPS